MLQEIGEKYLEAKKLLSEEEPVKGIDITAEKKKKSFCSWFS